MNLSQKLGGILSSFHVDVAICRDGFCVVVHLKVPRVLNCTLHQFVCYWPTGTRINLRWLYTSNVHSLYNNNTVCGKHLNYKAKLNVDNVLQHIRVLSVTYSHTLGFPMCPCCLGCDIYSRFCYLYELMILD